MGEQWQHQGGHEGAFAPAPAFLVKFEITVKRGFFAFVFICLFVCFFKLQHSKKLSDQEIWDLVSQNERQVARELKEIWLLNISKTNKKQKNFSRK